MDDKQRQLARASSKTPINTKEASVPDGHPQSTGFDSRPVIAPSEMVTVEYKHSLATRWMHWINFPLLFLMIYSGILIYWADSQHEGLHAHQVYRIGVGNWTLVRFFPRWFYNAFHLKFQLAQGLAYHFFFMWFFALNGIAYVTYTLLSGEWRNLVPTKKSFKGAVDVVLHDLGLSKRPLPELKFNHAQRIAYTGVVLMGAGSLLTGVAIYKPTELHFLTSLLGGYEVARWFHFWLTLGYVAFFLVHMAQVIRAGWNNFRAMVIGYWIRSTPSRQREMGKIARDVKSDEMRMRSRRGFLIAGAAVAAGATLWEWLNHYPRIDGLNAPFRTVLDLNGAIARGLFREKTLAPEYPQSNAVPFFRRNGDIGLADLRLEDWRLQVVGVDRPVSYAQFSSDVTSWIYGVNPSSDDAADVSDAPTKPVTHEDDAKGEAVSMKPMQMPADAHMGIPGLLLTMEDIKKLPAVEMITEFKCIEGWSEIVHWGGARLQDFLAAYPPHIDNYDDLHPANFVASLPEYVAFQTPDGQYYVGIEREVALHPQTLLAYELNGEPLSLDHGAPLRLVTPLKYGIKQIKQIGRITYLNGRPRDYWHEQGYDYYAGL